MRSPLPLLAVASLLASSCTAADPTANDSATPPPPTTIPPQPPPPPTTTTPQSDPLPYDIVRIDPTTFEQTTLGRVAFDANPPFQARVLAGNPDLENLVAELNQLGDFHYSNGTPVTRTDPRYFEFLRREWIEGKQQLSLRVPSTTDAVTRWELLVVEADALVRLGTVERSDVDYLRVVDGPTERRDQLGALLRTVNDVERNGLEVPPPSGTRGQAMQIVLRGTPLFFTLMRDRLRATNVMLVPAGQVTPQTITTVGPGPRLWAPASMSAVPVEHPVVIALSGPPGGPLGARVLHYDDVAYDDAALLAYVQAQHGDEPSFELGPATMVEIAGRSLRAVRYRTGSSLARATHLTALWPDGYEREKDIRDRGLAIELTVGGEREASDLLAHPQLAIIAASLQR